MSLKILQLENELKQKINELNESLSVQYLLCETLKSNTKTLAHVEDLLKKIDQDLKHSNDYINNLQRENTRLKCSCDEWMKLAIHHKLKVLSQVNVTKE